MQSKQESVVRSWHQCYAAGDRAAVLDHYANDAVWHVVWWREPLVGRDAIRAALETQFDGMANYRSETRTMLSKDAAVFVEGIDTFTRSGKEVILHWSVVLEINAEGKIAQQRDYWDHQELQAQLT